MLNDGAPFSRIYLKVGRTDLRKGIELRPRSTWILFRRTCCSCSAGDPPQRSKVCYGKEMDFCSSTSAVKPGVTNGLEV